MKKLVFINSVIKFCLNEMFRSSKIVNEIKTINAYRVQKITAYYQVNNVQSPVRNQKVNFLMMAQ